MNQLTFIARMSWRSYVIDVIGIIFIYLKEKKYKRGNFFVRVGKINW